MASQLTLPPPSGYPRPSSSAPDGSNQRLALDNMIRRELKVGDPNDPVQVANALLTRYQADPRARSITQEAQGMPFLQAVVAPPMPDTAGSSKVELDQATTDVDRDLCELTTNNLLKDIAPELEAWGTAIRGAIAQGVAAAPQALDPYQRDVTFSVRRQLGDFARLSRLLGAVTPPVNADYRNLAQSLDEVASVLLVMMGEALANVGFNGGRYLLKAPLAELQSRRAAVIYALRNLVGTAQEAYGPNDWPRGLDAYRRLFNRLDQESQGDLRALLQEAELTREMDNLVQLAAQGRAEGLRALGATSLMTLERFRRMVLIARNIGGTGLGVEAPAMAAFLEALLLFVDGFEGSGGLRLLHIARPPILMYGLYGNTGLDFAARRLVAMTVFRGELANSLDCLMACMCDTPFADAQALLDTVLYILDRAIDLYAVGRSDWGKPEQRAAAYGYVIQAVLNRLTASIANKKVTIDPAILTLLPKLVDELQPPALISKHGLGNSGFEGLVFEEIVVQRDMERRWKDLVRTMTPDCPSLHDLLGEQGELVQVMDEALALAQMNTRPTPSLESFPIPRDPDQSLDIIAHKFKP
jgi:hypothetical protein